MTTETVSTDAYEFNFGSGIYRDTGCEVAPKCLECPLPRCRYDVIGGVRELRNRDRDAEIERLIIEGVPVDDIADQFRLSRRRVFGIAQAARA